MSVATDPGDVAAQLNAGHSVTIRRICDCRNATYIGEEEAKANAQLIAAAPELLAELLKLRTLYLDALSGNFAEIFISGTDWVSTESVLKKAGVSL